MEADITPAAVHVGASKTLKWLLPMVMTALGGGAGWAIKAASSGAVLEERVRVLGDVQSKVDINDRRVTTLETKMDFVVDGVKEINAKLESLNITGRRSR